MLLAPPQSWAHEAWFSLSFVLLQCLIKAAVDMARGLGASCS